ncbi:MAG: CotH kinase family protein, partial [Flavobacteriales bacterium]
AKMVYDGKTYEGIGVAFKGQTSYNRLTSTQLKKSFTVNMEFSEADVNVGGYESLNFYNAFEDPTNLREVLYGILARKHSPAVRTNFIHLSLNDQDWGIYPNVQQINGEFIREWWFSNDGIRWRADATTGGGGLSRCCGFGFRFFLGGTSTDANRQECGQQYGMTHNGFPQD